MDPIVVVAICGLIVGQGIALATFFQSRAASAHAAEAAIQASSALQAALIANANVKELDVKVDGRLTELLAASIGEARGEGHAAGREEVKAEVASGQIAPLPTPVSPMHDSVQTTTVTTHTDTHAADNAIC